MSSSFAPLAKQMSVMQYHALQTDPITSNEVFESEVSALRSFGFDFPKADVDRLRQFVPEKSQLFLVVPPQPDTLDLANLMGRVKLKGLFGESELEPQYLVNTFDVPTTSHLLLDVDDGRKRLNKNALDSFKDIKTANRIPYSTWHGIIHAMLFPCVLEQYSVILVGSQYNYSDTKSVPYIYRDTHGIPRLAYLYPQSHGVTCGTPSARSMVGM